MANQITSRLQLTRDTKDNWKSKNQSIHLEDGEIAVVYSSTASDATVELVFGDGTSLFAELEYFSDYNKVDKACVGLPNGLVPLDDKGKIPTEFIPTVMVTDGEYVPSTHKLSIYDYGWLLPDKDIKNNRVYFIVGEEIDNYATGSYSNYHTISDNDYGTELPNDIDTADGRIFFLVDDTDSDKLPKNPVSTTNIHVVGTSDYGETLPTKYLDKGRVFFKLGTETVDITGGSAKPDPEEPEEPTTPPVTPVDPIIDVEPAMDPTFNEYMDFTGTAITPKFNYDKTKIDMYGDTAATDVGEYTVYFKPKTGYTWRDGSTDAKEIKYYIRAIPSMVSAVDYDDNLPTTNLTDGRVFYKTESDNPDIDSSADPAKVITDINYGNELPTDNLTDGRIFYKFKEPLDEYENTNTDAKTIQKVSADDYGTELPTTNLRDKRLFYKTEE